MRLFSQIILFFAAIFCAQFAHAEIAVGSGGRVKLFSGGAVDQMCHSLGRMSAGIIQPPRGGTIVIEAVNDYPNFSMFNTLSRCNTLRVPLTRISYQSTPGYSGYDETMIDVIGPLGRIYHLHYLISVHAGFVLPQPPMASAAPRHYASRHHFVRAVAHVAKIRPAAQATPKPAHKKPKQEDQTIGI